jgi:hypothetical protein
MNLETIYEQCAKAGEKASKALMGPGDCLDFARAAIETYLKLNPFWVKASDRMPTAEDADDEGCVATMFRDKEESIFGYEYIGLLDSECLWTSIKHLPPPPDPFTEWYAKQPGHITSLPKETVKEIYQSLTTTKP